MYDIVIKNGSVYDSASRSFVNQDVGIRDGRIAFMGRWQGTSENGALDGKTLENGASEGAVQELDAEGCLVTPGLMDMHCHIYPAFPRQADSLPAIDPDVHLIASGITTAVDAGTCGLDDFFTFKESVIDRSAIRILAFLNIARGGMVRLSSEQEPNDFLTETVGDVAKKYDCIVGIKTAHYTAEGEFDRFHEPWSSVDAALSAGKTAGKPVMTDVRPIEPERTFKDLLKKLRKGDIHTHIFARHFDILDEYGKIRNYIREAKEKGVVFDLGHGAGSFVFDHSYPACSQGFYPDTISTDLYADNINGPAFSLLSVMNKCMAMGMPLEEVLYRVTAAPARVIGRQELGALQPDGDGDVAIFRLKEGTCCFQDCDNRKIEGHKALTCIMTIKSGKILYNPEGMGLPLWRPGGSAPLEGEA